MSEEKKTMLCDVDGVILDLLTPWVDIVNKRYGTNVCVDDIVDYNLAKAFPMLEPHCIYDVLQEEELWLKAQPKPQVSLFLNELMCLGVDVRIVTATHWKNAAYKFEWFQRYLPFISWDQFIISNDKSIINGDLLIDDNPQHILKTSCSKKLLFDAPYNRVLSGVPGGYIRVDDWSQVFSQVCYLLNLEI